MTSPCRILLLEDNASDAELIQELLEGEHFDCEITRVQTRAEFITALAGNEIDLILADYKLPSFDGISALKLALSSHPDLPFIFVSGTLGEEVAIEALKIGATDYVLKTRLSRLVPSVQRALREAGEKAERKKAVEALRRSEEAARRSEKEFRDAIETIPAMVCIALPDGHADFSIGAGRSTRACLIEQSLGWDWGATTVHPEDAEQYFRKWRECSQRVEPFEEEVRFRRGADGEYRWFLVRGVPLRDEQGNVLKWYGVVTDIEDRKRAEELARRNESELREFIESIPVMVWSALPDGHVDFINRRWQEFTGLTLDETLGWNWESEAPFHPDDVDAYMVKWQASLATGQSFEHEMRIRRAADGEYRWLFENAVPLRDEQGNILKWYGFVVDIEDRKRAEGALQEALAELAHVNRVATMGQLTASIAHEVNQPIAAAVTNAEVALHWLGAYPPNLEEVRQALDEIVKSGNRAADVIDRIRALIKKAPPRKGRFDLNEAVRDVIALTRSEVLRHGVSLKTELATGLPPAVGDRVQLQQVILNLVMNGIEAMKEVADWPRELLIRSQPDEAGAMLVAVQDSGVGLDPQSVKQVFEAFYTTKPDGMGMGLAICRSIIEAHGGRLWATANEPRGAVFQFALPPERDETVTAEHAGQI